MREFVGIVGESGVYGEEGIDNLNHNFKLASQLTGWWKERGL